MRWFPQINPDSQYYILTGAWLFFAIFQQFIRPNNTETPISIIAAIKFPRQIIGIVINKAFPKMKISILSNPILEYRESQDIHPNLTAQMFDPSPKIFFSLKLTPQYIVFISPKQQLAVLF